jgi:hypothetical protein
MKKNRKQFSFNPEDGDDMFPRNVTRVSPGYTALYPRRYNFS